MKKDKQAEEGEDGEDDPKWLGGGKSGGKRKVSAKAVVVLAAVALAIFAAGLVYSHTVEVQLNVKSGELRNRYTAFGVQAHVSRPRANALSLAAKQDGLEGDWLTVSTRSHYRSPCREDYRSLIPQFTRDRLPDQKASGELARSALQELDERRSISSTTNHVSKALRVFWGSDSRRPMLECWEVAGGDAL